MHTDHCTYLESAGNVASDLFCAVISGVENVGW